MTPSTANNFAVICPFRAYVFHKIPSKQWNFVITRAAYNDTSAQSRLSSRAQPGRCRGGESPMMTAASVSLI